MSRHQVILCTVPRDSTGQEIAEKLVGKKLAACVNIIRDIHSTYIWKGEICRDDENLLIIKTRASLTEAVKSEIQSMHPYDVPEIIALNIENGLVHYLSWIDDSTEEHV